MIVLWVNKRNWKTAGPIVNMAVWNAASFARIGLESHLCIGAGPASSTQADLRDFYDLSPLDRLHVHRVPRAQMGNATSSLSVFYHAHKLAKGLARRDRLLICTRECGFLPFLARLCRDPRITGLYELHDLYADLSWVAHKKINHYREHLLEHLFLPRISGLICITRAQQRFYRRIFPQIPSIAFPLGTRPFPPADWEARRKRRTVMYVGRLHGEKGIDFLLSAAPGLAARRIRLLIWGGFAKTADAMNQKVRQMGLSDRVCFVPFQAPRAMHQALQEQASLGVVMLENGFYNRYLTCPVKALDYLSHGLPSLGSDIPSVREVLADAGTYLAEPTPHAFIQKAEALLNAGALYRKTAEQTLSRARAISWPKRARAISRFASQL